MLVKSSLRRCIACYLRAIFRFVVYQCSREYKDIFEYYVDGENLKFLLDGLVDGALTLAKADGINQIK